MRHAKHALVAFGANLAFGENPPQVTLRLAVTSLGKAGLVADAISRFFATPCFPIGAGPDYVNAAAALQIPHGWGAPDVLAILHQVEAEFGRERTQRWGMRSLDLDLLAFGQRISPDKATFQAWQQLPPDTQRTEAPHQLILPHPRLQDRAFVLVPLADVAPNWRHPVLGKTTLQMLNDLPPEDVAAVIPLLPR